MDLMTLRTIITIDTKTFETGVQKIKAAFEDLEKRRDQLPPITDKMKSIGTAMETAGTKISNVGKSLAPISAAFGAVAISGTKSFAEVDRTMALTNQTMGNTQKESKMLGQAMKDAAAQSVFGMNDAATASLNFARAGLDASQAASTLAPAMNLAAGEGGNLDTVSGGLVATINGFHDSFDNAGRYADVFAAACNNSALDVDGLSSAMSVAAPVFSAAGYSVNDAALYMGTMANAGIDANVAANSLKTGMSRLVSPAKQGAEMMDKLGISVTNADGTMKDSTAVQSELHDAFSKLSDSEQLAAASAIFGKNQMAPWLALINTAPNDVRGLSTELDGASTSITSFDGTLQQNGTSLSDLKSRMAELGVSGEEFESAFKASGGSAQKFVENLKGAADAGVSFQDVCSATGMSMGELQKVMSDTKGTTDEMANAMMSGFGGSLMQLSSSIDVAKYSLGEALAPAISKVATAIQDAVNWFNSLDASQQQTIAQVVALVAALSPVLVVGGKIVSGVGKVIGVVSKVPAAIAAVSGVVSTLATFLTGTMIPAITGFIGAAAGIVAPFLPFIAIAAGVVGAGVLIYKNWDTIKEKAGQLKEGVSQKWNALKDGITQTVENIRQTTSQKWENIKSTASQKAESMRQTVSQKWNALKTNVGQTVDNIRSMVSTKWENIKTAVSQKSEQIKSGLSTKWNNIKSITGQAWDAIKSGTSSKWGQIKSTIQQNGGGIKGVIQTTLNGYKNIWNIGFSAINTATGGKMGEVVSTVRNKVSEAANAFKSVNWAQLGSDIISGVISGISNAASSLYDSLKNLAKNALDAAKNALGIESPSKVFRDEVGKNIATGLALGIDKNANAVDKAIDNITDVSDVKTKVKTQNNSHNNASAGSNVVINVYGAIGQSVEELANVVADRINHATRQQIMVWS